MGKRRFTNKELSLLDTMFREVVKVKDPILFIDLLAFSSYTAGSFGNKVPVDQTRKCFMLWLNKYTEELDGNNPNNS